MVPEREPTLTALGIFPPIGVLVQQTVVLRHPHHQGDLFLVKEVLDHQVTPRNKIPLDFRG